MTAEVAAANQAFPESKPKIEPKRTFTPAAPFADELLAVNNDRKSTPSPSTHANTAPMATSSA